MVKSRLIEWIKANKAAVVTAILSIVAFAIIFAVYYDKAVVANRIVKVKLITTEADNLPQQQLLDGEVATENFLVDTSFDGFKLRFSVAESNLTGDLHVELQNASHECVQTWVEDIQRYQANQVYDFSLDHTEVVEQQTQYLLRIWVENTRNAGHFFVYYTNGDSYTDGVFAINGVDQGRDLAFSVYHEEENYYPFIGPMYIILGIVSFILLGVSFYILFIGKWKIENVFLIVVGTLGVLYMIILPPFSAPDEPVHFGTSYALSSKIMGTQAYDENVGFVLVPDELNCSYETIPTADTYKYTIDHLCSKLDYSSKAAYKHINLFSKNIITHLPSALGITIARVLHLGIVQLICFGRLGNLIFFLACTYFAIKKIPFGKMLLFAISATPMMLELVSSFSYDAIVNALAFLTTAFIMQLIFEKEKVGWKDIVGLAILAFLLAPSKIVYSVIFWFCIFIPKDKFSKKSGIWILLGSAFGMIVLSNLYINFNAVQGMSGASDTASTGEVVERYSLMWCLYNPIEAAKRYALTTLVYGKYYIMSMFGSLLGWLEIKLSDWVIYFFVVVTALASFEGGSEQYQVKKRHRFMAIACMGIVYVLVLASMLFGWTPFSSRIILGVQGRYFLTILPMLSILFYNNNKIFHKIKTSYLCIGIVIFNYLALTQVYEIICSR